MPTIDLLRDHQKLYLGKMCAMGCGICMCSTHVRELLCVVLLSFFCFHWPKHRALSGAIRHPEVLRYWPVSALLSSNQSRFAAAAAAASGIHFISNFFYFEEKAWALLSQLFISVPFMYIMYLQLVCCFITRLQAPIHAFQCLTSQIDTTNLFFPSFIHNFKTCYLIWILLNAFAHLLIACRFFTTFRVVSSFDDTIRFSSNIFLTFPNWQARFQLHNQQHRLSMDWININTM